jgi:predicted ATPase/transcriptional regulator with XRE-family HTH domain
METAIREEEKPPAFRQLLKRHRIAAGLTQEALAEQARMSARGVSDIERGISGSPRLETVRLLADALRLKGGQRSVFMAAARPDETPDRGSPRLSTLPAQLTPLVGRSGEVAAIREPLMRPEVRLVTLIGPGGIGKTRLALQVGTELEGAFTAGVTAVMLVTVRDAALVAPTVAQALRLQEVANQSHQDHLMAFLHQRNMLLVLDNFEQILDAAALVKQLLEACPQLSILVTSRAALHVPGDHEFPVPPLPLPPPAADAGYEIAGSAVELFLQRAQAVDPDFRLTADNLATVNAICARLDGLPLAIELAAARMKLLTPQALLVRLGRRLDVSRTAPDGRDESDRHRTLRATLVWSHDLLSKEEKGFFRRLAVFSGGFGVEAAESVCARDQEGGQEVLEVLAGLVDESLVRRVKDADGEPRLTMLDTIHEYARERLEESGEAETVRRRHAEFFLRMAEGIGSALEPALERRGYTDRTWSEYDAIQTEHDNMRAALAWSLDGGDDGELALRLAVALARFWEARGYWREGRSWLERALARTARSGDTVSRARALSDLAAVANAQGDLAAAHVAGERGVELLRGLGDKRGLARALAELGWTVLQRGDPDRARSLYEEQVALWREVGNLPATARALDMLSWVELRQGNTAAARQRLEKALATVRDLAVEQDPQHTITNVYILRDLANLEWWEGDEKAARKLTEETLALARTTGDDDVLVSVLSLLSRAPAQRGDYELAWSLTEESLRLARALGREEGFGTVGWAANFLGDIARAKGDLAQAEALYEESRDHWEQEGNTQGRAIALHNLGHVALSRGEVAPAEAYLAESLRLFHALRFDWSVADALAGLAGVACHQGRFERAARLFGAAQAIHDAIDKSGQAAEPANRAAWERDIALGRDQIDEGPWDESWAAGAGMSLEETVAAALEN